MIFVTTNVLLSIACINARVWFMTPEIDPIEAILTHLGGDTSVFADGVYRKAGYCNIQLSVPNVTLKTMLLFGAKIDCSH